MSADIADVTALYDQMVAQHINSCL